MSLTVGSMSELASHARSRSTSVSGLASIPASAAALPSEALDHEPPGGVRYQAPSQTVTVSRAMPSGGLSTDAPVLASLGRRSTCAVVPSSATRSSGRPRIAPGTVPLTVASRWTAFASSTDCRLRAIISLGSVTWSAGVVEASGPTPTTPPTRVRTPSTATSTATPTSGPLFATILLRRSPGTPNGRSTGRRTDSPVGGLPVKPGCESNGCGSGARPWVRRPAVGPAPGRGSAARPWVRRPAVGPAPGRGSGRPAVGPPTTTPLGVNWGVSKHGSAPNPAGSVASSSARCHG